MWESQSRCSEVCCRPLLLHCSCLKQYRTVQLIVEEAVQLSNATQGNPQPCALLQNIRGNPLSTLYTLYTQVSVRQSSHTSLYVKDNQVVCVCTLLTTHVEDGEPAGGFVVFWNEINNTTKNSWMRVLPGAQWIWLLQTDALSHRMTARCLAVTCLSRHRLWWFPHLTVPAPPQLSSHWLIVRPLWRIHNSQIVNGGSSLSRMLLNIYLLLCLCIEEKWEQWLQFLCTCMYTVSSLVWVAGHSINRQSCAETKATPKLKICDRKSSCWYPSASRGFSESCSLK